MASQLSLSTLKGVLITLFFSFLFSSCEKESNQTDDNVGISKKYWVDLDFKMENITNTDTVAKPIKVGYMIFGHDTITVSNGYSSTGFSNSGININKDEANEIEFSSCFNSINNFLIQKSFQITYLDNEIELAVDSQNSLQVDKKEMMLINSFIDTAQISKYQNWAKFSGKNSICFISYYYDYDNHLFIDSNHVTGSINIDLNTNLNSEYIGIRKKLDYVYVYGWIKYSIENNEKLLLSDCSFYE